MRFTKHTAHSDATQSAKNSRRRLSNPIGYLAVLSLLTFGGDLFGQSAYDADGVPQVQRPGLDQIDHITEALRRAGKVCVKVGIVVLVLAGLKILNPLQFYYAARDRSLKKAVRDVEDLLKRIREVAEAAHEDVTDEQEEGGLLAAMPEVAAAKLSSMMSGSSVNA